MKSTELKRLRVEVLGLSQQQFADTLGLSRAQLSRYENGVMLIPEQLVDKLKIYPQLPYVSGEKAFEQEEKIKKTAISTRYKKIYMDLCRVSGDLQYAEVAIKDLDTAECYELAGKVKRCETVLKEVMNELALLDGKALKNVERV